MGRFLPRPQGAGNHHLNYLKAVSPMRMTVATMKAADATRAAANATMMGSVIGGSFRESGFQELDTCGGFLLLLLGGISLGFSVEVVGFCLGGGELF